MAEVKVSQIQVLGHQYQYVFVGNAAGSCGKPTYRISRPRYLTTKWKQFPDLKYLQYKGSLYYSLNF